MRIANFLGLDGGLDDTHQDEKVRALIEAIEGLKADLNKMLQATSGAENELIKELETAISDVARYAR